MNADQPREFELNIPSQAVEAALTELATQVGAMLLFPYDPVQSVESNEVVGRYTVAEALEILLEGTSLVGGFTEGGVITISQRMSVNALDELEGDEMNVKKKAGLLATLAAVFSGANAQEPAGSNEAELEFEEIIVTGTSIRGVVPESSPLDVYDAIDIRNSGAQTTEQFIATLPQNNKTLSEVGVGSSSRDLNDEAVSSVDLRGLGVGSTLVLLNGRRIAPSSNGRAVDISFIPIAAIERVEVLTDGASAIYGADAISGVVNFVLRDKQEGAETVLTYSDASGGAGQWRIDQSFGFNWDSGNAVVFLSYMDRSSLDAADRQYSMPAGRHTLVPEDTRKNVFATISQTVAADVNVSADLLYSSREPRTESTLTQFGTDDLSIREMEQQQIVLNLALEKGFGDNLHGSLLATVADASADTEGFQNGPTIGIGPFFESQDTNTLDISATVDGELARLSSGSLRFALGLGYREEQIDEYRDFTVTDDFTSEVSLERDVKYAFAELLLPLAGPEQNIRGVRRLEVSLSARYEEFSDFDEGSSPKIGVLWSPVEQLKIRGTYGESFKAPTLFQLSPANNFYFLFPVSAFPFVNDIWSTDGSSVMLLSTAGTRPGLGPEEAETYTFGFDLDLTKLSVTATYFNIDYTDRIARPDPTAFDSLVNPQNFAELYTTTPSLERVTEVLSGVQLGNLTGLDPSDPSAVLAGITVYGDQRTQNLAISEINGIDLSVNYTTELSVGTLSAGVSASKIFSFEDRLFASAPTLTRVDTVLYPAELKARGYLGFAKETWNTRLNINYVDEYDNPFDDANPRVDNWTTVDWLFSYDFPEGRSGLSDGLRLNITVQNIFDEDPPLVPNTSRSTVVNPVGFDPANANPLGRVVGFQVSKSW